MSLMLLCHGNDSHVNTCFDTFKLRQPSDGHAGSHWREGASYRVLDKAGPRTVRTANTDGHATRARIHRLIMTAQCSIHRLMITAQYSGSTEDDEAVHLVTTVGNRSGGEC